jgi:drug/metabolite transporter (DMT)-like permease
MPAIPADHRKGIVLILAALSTLICLDAASKYAVQKIPVTAAVWSRYAGHMLVVFALAFPTLRSGLWKTRHLPFQLLRGVLLAVMTLCFFNAFRTLPLAHGTAILFLTPILITLWARWFLEESVTLTQWGAVLLGFVGVIVICRPGSGLDGQGVLYALGAALANSVYQILTRRASGQDRPETQLFFTGLVGAAVMSVSLPAWWTPVSADGWHWAAFGLLGVLGAAGHWLMVKAYDCAPAAVLAPWMYLQLILALLLGWVMFGDVPDTPALAGMALVALAPQLTRIHPWKPKSSPAP